MTTKNKETSNSLSEEPNTKDLTPVDTGNKRKISINFFNAQSLLNKLDELSEWMDKQRPDIVGVVETWFDESHNVSRVSTTKLQY